MTMQFFKAYQFIYLFVLSFVSITTLFSHNYNQVSCQIAKWDTDFRIDSYNRLIKTLNNLVNKNHQITGTGYFNKLVVSQGSLILTRQVSPATHHVLDNKTRNYVSSKLTEVQRIQNVIDSIQRTLKDPNKAFVYKGNHQQKHPNSHLYQSQQHHLGPYGNRQTNGAIVFSGKKLFNQFAYANSITSNRVDLKSINNSYVERVLDRAYMKHYQHSLFDSQKRLYFEGSKTISSSVFLNDLHSGCCGRLKPIHTDRLLTKSSNQTIPATVYLLTPHHQRHHRQAGLPPPTHVSINTLNFDQLLERTLTLGLTKTRSGLKLLKILPSPVSSNVQLADLIYIRQHQQHLQNSQALVQIPKSLLFTSIISVENLNLNFASSNPYGFARILIGPTSGKFLALSPNDFLLQTPPSNPQTSSQSIVNLRVSSASVFEADLVASSLNEVGNFVQFVMNSLARIDRQTAINGPIQFLSSHSHHDGQNLYGQPLAVVNKQVIITRTLNALNLLQDLIQIKYPSNHLTIRGPLVFNNSRINMDFVTVTSHINGLSIPNDVVPLNLNDAINNLGSSNLVFLDGINVNQLTVRNRYFDKLHLSDAFEDAESFILRTSFIPTPDGKHIIKAKLIVVDLVLSASGSNRGSINGFRPNEIINFANIRQESILGTRFFNDHIEAGDCHFQNLNNMNNWANHLIRTDRPKFVQTVHTNLVFSSGHQLSQSFTPGADTVTTNTFNVGFLPNMNEANYMLNYNAYPELYTINQVLFKATNQEERRLRVEHVRLLNPRGKGLVNGIPTNLVQRLDQTNFVPGKAIFVGKVYITNDMQARYVTSSYPIEGLDLDQFDKYRIQFRSNGRVNYENPVRVNNLVLTGLNLASTVRFSSLNELIFDQYINSVMSLTRPQFVRNPMIFLNTVNFFGHISSNSSLNNIDSTSFLGQKVRDTIYKFNEGLECQRVYL